MTDDKPRLCGDHPYRTNTKFMRDSSGAFVRDDDGHLVPTPQIKEANSARRIFAVSRERAYDNADQERKDMAKERRRINKRQRIGDPSCEQSRDEDFPLLAVLRRDGNDEAIRVVSEYRRLAALCAAEPLKGIAYSSRQATGLSVEYRSKKMDGVSEVNLAKRAGWKGDNVPDGEIEYDGRVRKSKGAHSLPPRRKVAIEYDDNCEAPTGRTESLHVKVTEDVLHERIDKYPLLLRIRSSLGPLVDLFEDAVLGGQTLQSIGERAGFRGRDAASAGKALVMQAVSTVDGFLGVKKYVAANDNYLIEYKKLA